MAQIHDGTFRVPGGFKIQNNVPVDDRMVVDELNDLSTLPNVYAGIVVAVADESYALYRWNGNSQTQSSNWIEVGSGGSSGGSASIIEYTPTGATDSTYPVGTFTYDSSFIYSRVSNTEWKKAYLYAFGDTSGGDGGSGDGGSGDGGSGGGGSSSSIMSGSWEFKPVDSDGVLTDNETLNNSVSTLSFGSSSIDDTNFTAALNAITTSNTFTLTDGTSSVDYDITSISTTEAFAYTGSTAFTLTVGTMQLANDIYDAVYLDDINKYFVSGNNKSYILNPDLTYNMNNAGGGHYNSQNFKRADGSLLRTLPNSNLIYKVSYAPNPLDTTRYTSTVAQSINTRVAPYNLPNADWHVAYHSVLDKIYVIGSNLNIEVYTIVSGGVDYVKTGSYSITPPTEGSLTFIAGSSTINESGNKLYIGLSSTSEASTGSGYSNHIVNWDCTTDTQGLTWSDSSVYSTDNRRRGHLKGYKMVFSSNLNKIYYEYIQFSSTFYTQIYSVDVSTGTFVFVTGNGRQFNSYSPTSQWGNLSSMNTRLTLDPLEDLLIAPNTYLNTHQTQIINLNDNSTVTEIGTRDGDVAVRNTLTREIFIPSTEDYSGYILEPIYTPNDKVWNFSVSYSTGNNANWAPALGDTIQVTLT